MDLKSVTRIIELFVPYYTQKHRHYHNWKHITTVLDAAVRLVTAGHKTDGDYTDLPTPLLLAIIAHDSVYVPFTPYASNERASSALLYTLFDQGLLPASVLASDIDFARNLIELTAKHICKGQRLSFRPRAAAVMMNCDLITMAAPQYRDFLRVQASIAREFPGTTKQDQVEFLSLFLNGPVFAGSRDFNHAQTQMVLDWEKRARANIQRFISENEAPPKV